MRQCQPRDGLFFIITDFRVGFIEECLFDYPISSKKPNISIPLPIL
jgi:hypothetical protein